VDTTLFLSFTVVDVKLTAETKAMHSHTNFFLCPSLCLVPISQVMLEVKAVHLCAKETQFGGGGTTLPLPNSDTERDWVVSTMLQLPYTWERDPVLLVWVAGRASGVGLDGYKIFRPCWNSNLRTSSV
jgi:hypothetical protein